MIPEPVSYRRHRFPAAIISHAVWLYHVFSLSLRDVELILAERGVTVTHESVRAWCRKFGAEFAKRLRRHRPQPGDIWHLDEVFVRITARFITSGARSTRMASSSTFWSKAAGMPLPPSASSSACYEDFDTSRGA